METSKNKIIFQLVNNWKYKDFCFGINFSSEKYDENREYYIALHLTFWQLFIGIRI